MCAARRNPLFRNPAIRNLANHYRLICIRPERARKTSPPLSTRPCFKAEGLLHRLSLDSTA
eukprot:2898869-Alexandrium_andersonii.AAC.1